MKEEMKDTIDVLLKLDIDADDFFAINIYKNELWFFGYQSEKSLERFPNGVYGETDMVKHNLYTKWKIGNINITVILTPII